MVRADFLNPLLEPKMLPVLEPFRLCIPDFGILADSVFPADAMMTGLKVIWCLIPHPATHMWCLIQNGKDGQT